MEKGCVRKREVGSMQYIFTLVKTCLDLLGWHFPKTPLYWELNKESVANNLVTCFIVAISHGIGRLIICFPHSISKHFIILNIIEKIGKRETFAAMISDHFLCAWDIGGTFHIEIILVLTVSQYIVPQGFWAIDEDDLDQWYLTFLK